MNKKLYLLLLLTLAPLLCISQINSGFGQFIPHGFLLIDSIKGDLYQDNRTDIVLIIKDTQKA